MVDKPELGKVLLKCPSKDCKQSILVSFLKYPKYNKTKRPRRGTVHFSNARWYIYVVQAHLLKYHKNEAEDLDADEKDDDENGDENQRNESNDEGFRDIPNENHSSNSNQNERYSAEIIQIRNENLSQNDEQPSTSNQNVDRTLKRKPSSTRTVQFDKKYKK